MNKFISTKSHYGYFFDVRHCDLLFPSQSSVWIGSEKGWTKERGMLLADQLQREGIASGDITGWGGNLGLLRMNMIRNWCGLQTQKPVTAPRTPIGIHGSVRISCRTSLSRIRWLFIKLDCWMRSLYCLKSWFRRIYKWHYTFGNFNYRSMFILYSYH